MLASRWIRRWRSAHAAQDCVSTLVRAAARGEPLDAIVDLGAHELLSAAHADRAGLWLIANKRGESARGLVVEATRTPVPDQWKHLDLSISFLRTTLQSIGPLRVALGPRETICSVGPLIGMHSAIWIPLRAGDRTLGLAMVAYAQPAVHPNMAVLQGRADEIAVTVVHHRDAGLIELASEELLAQLRLSRAILCGVSLDSILPQIAHAARHYLQAEFIALGLGSAPPISDEGWDGPVEWAKALHDGPLLQLWRKAFCEGLESEISGETILAWPGAGPVAGLSPGPHLELVSVIRTLDRVIAIPIEARNRICGVFMAGLLSSEDPSSDFARLGSYALLADSAVDREFARKERVASEKSLKALIQESRECLAVIDEKGIICDMSRTAATLLLLPWGRREQTPIEECFSPEGRDAVTQWRQQITSHNSALIYRPEKSSILPEAELLSGSVVRLSLRSELEGSVGKMPRWLIHFEDLGGQQALEDSQGRLEVEMASLMDSIESGVLLTDASGNIRMASSRLGAILGFEARRLLELGNIEALIETVASHFARPNETAVRWREHVRRGDEASWDEFELVRPSRRIVERFARPLFKPDGIRLGWLEVYRDITGQRLIQSKLLQTEKMAALGQLVSGIAHELNNPLTSIQGYAQLLLSRHPTSDRSADARHISQEAERAARIVKNLLLFSRETKPERRGVNLNELIERTLAFRAYELKLENIAVELALDPALPQTLADAAQLQQVVLNLIVNAEQAIVQARGEEARHGQIAIRTRRLAGDRIGMEISDDGAGILPEVVSRIFDPFFTTKPAGVGTGLGLSIVYGIVQEHGGEVSVESQPGRGATLSVELPALSVAGFDFAKKEPAIAAHASDVVSHSFSVRAARSERILVVEDEPTVAQLISDVMTEEGHRVDMLLDSREAVRTLEESKYMLVICDLKMPHMDGPGLYRALVRRGSPTQHRILFVTGDTMSPRTLEFLKASGLPYLAKPFLVEELKEAVRLALASVPVSDEIADIKEWPKAAMRGK